MPGLLDSLPILFAQNAGAPAAGGGSAAPALLTFLPYIAIAVLWFYLLIIRPQQRTDRERKTLLNAVKKNDRILTSSGIYGTVVSVDPDSDKVIVRIDDDKGVRATFSKGAIVRIFDGSEKEKSAKEKVAESK